MTQSRVSGSFVALVTPFDDNGEIDFGAFRTLIDWQAEHGTSAVLIMGSTGEVSMLTPDEKRAIITRCAPMGEGRLQVWFGCTGPSTEATIDYLRHAVDAGADGAILAAPPYICAPADDIEAYFAECADAVELPMGIYNNPPRVSTDLGWDAICRLMEHPNMVVLKESTSRVGQVAQVLARRPDCAVMCCDSPNLGLVVPTMSLGGHGTANMSGNIDPAGMARLSTPWEDPEQGFVFRDTYLSMLPVLDFTYCAVNPIPVKTLMNAVGLPVGPLRKPLRPLPAAQLQAGLDMVRRTGLDERYGWKLPNI